MKRTKYVTKKNKEDQKDKKKGLNLLNVKRLETTHQSS